MQVLLPRLLRCSIANTRAALGLAAFVLCIVVPANALSETPVQEAAGKLTSGALWAARVPTPWNGTVLLYSHGYALTIKTPELAPPGLESWLLDHGYALAASSYSKPGWALAEAVPDQLATLESFAQHFGEPKRTIAWGNSMGGLVTVALAEHHPKRIDGALPSCGSIAGSLAMMNLALDGAFAFTTLIAPDSGIAVVRTGDDRVNAERARVSVEGAVRSPAGRARLALAATLAQMPSWTDPGTPEPGADEAEAQLDQMARSFVAGVFLPRADQEQRAGGVFSWNTGINYRQQLERSGRRGWVEYFYKKAGLSLDQDLTTLAGARRITADPAAVDYMRAHYAPTGELAVPMLSYHTLGDGMTVPAMQSAYRQAVTQAGTTALFRAAWVHGAGHCAFQPAEHIGALQTLESRLNSGQWSVAPTDLNARAASSALGMGRFVDYEAPNFLRPCSASQQRCEGQPSQTKP